MIKFKMNITKLKFSNVNVVIVLENGSVLTSLQDGFAVV
jgi:hypothetical protein